MNRQLNRQMKIMDFWEKTSTIDYTDSDYDAWLFGLDEDSIEIQEEIVQEAVKRVLAVQKKLVQKKKERGRLRLLKQ